MKSSVFNGVIFGFGIISILLITYRFLLAKDLCTELQMKKIQKK